MFANVMKNRKTTRSCRKDGLLGSKESSQEDVYSFESLGESQEGYYRKGKKLKIGVLKSKLDQDSDPYGFNSLKESEEFKNVVEDTQNVKKRRIGSGFTGLGGSYGGGSGNLGNLDKGFVRKSNRKNLDGDSDPYGFNSLQESEDFKNVLEDTKKAKKGGVVNGKENGVFVKKEKGKKEKKGKIGESDDSGRSSLNSSQQSGELEGFGQGYGGGSENLDKDSDPYGFNSLQESEEFKSVIEGTHEAKEGRIGDGKENGKKEKNEVSSLDTKTPTVTLIKAQESGEMMDDMDKGCVSKSCTLNLDEDSDPYGLNSLKESEELKDVFEEANKGKILNGEENGVLVKKEKGKKVMKEASSSYTEIPMETLMESHESGEMMDDVDEVNFMSLDGLRKGQPVRIRRESLLSLLMSCRTSQQRQLLRDHGLAKTIMNSILELSLDDSPSNLAAATLFYILTNDGQDDRLLSSSNCIRFVIKLLKPVTRDSGNVEAPTIGRMLLSLHMDASCSQESVNGLDSTAHAITKKVHDILVSCKEFTLEEGDDYGNERPELDPKWIALLTMGKACVSRVSIEDISGITFKAGSSRFKGKLRELGGLDAIFEVARSCHNKIKGWSEQSNIKVAIGGLVLLLKCLKIMENVTFLSKDNQRHLLEMKGNFDNRPSPRSFVKLLLSVIKILSAMSLQCSSDKPDDENCSQPTTSDSNSRLLKSRLDCSSLVPCNNKLVNGSKKKFDSINREEAESSKMNETDVSEDPFAFDEVDSVPSSWDFVSGRKKAPSSQQESNGMAVRKASTLVAECLLTAVKALMNLTNDNPLGCQQIAANGGLESLSLLITYHFSLKASSQVNLENDRHLSDQELDFLVAVLGLLVNLVEKDGQNRSRLASARVASSDLKNANDESCGDVIPLLCSIFLANQGPEETAEEGKCFSLNDDDAFSQGEKEAEKMIIEAYAALLLAFLSTESKSIRDAIAMCLPDRSLSILVPVLERFAEFHFALNMISSETHTAVLEVIESCRLP